MQITYGPPAARGVTQLMAVGAADFEETATDRAVQNGGLLALAIFGIGVLSGSKTVRHLGLGAAGALFLVRATSRRRRTVEVSAVAPTPSAGW